MNRGAGKGTAGLLLCLAVLMFCSTSAAQTDLLRKIGGRMRFKEMRIRAGLSDFLSSENQRWGRFVLTDNVSLVAETLTLRAESVVLWIDPKAATRQNRERKVDDDLRPTFFRRPGSGNTVDYGAVQGIYAEGDVHLQHAGQVVRAEQLYFDVAENKAIIVHGYVSAVLTRPGRPRIPFFARAEQLKVMWDQALVGSKKQFSSIKGVEAKNANVTTCNYGVPHYHVKARDLHLETSDEDNTRFLSLSETTINVFETPVFYIPYLAGDSSIIDYFPLKSVSFGTSKRFGTEVQTLWGDEIKLRDRNGVARRWGEWLLNLDNRTRRGNGVGLTLKYETDDYFGYATGYYQRDKSTDFARDRNFDPPDNDRGRFRLFHRQQLPAGFQLDVEQSWIRDRNFLFEYFDNEARNGKIQENYAYLKRDYENMTARVLYRYRVNDFFTRTEYLPRVSGNIISQPLVPGGLLGTNIYVDADGEAAQLRLRIDEAFNAPSFEANRGDVGASVEVPLTVGPIHINPFFGGRYTSWTETLFDDSNDDRHAWTGGVRAYTQFWKVFKKGFFGIDMRHEFMPEVLYRNTYDVSFPSNRVIPFDRKDIIDEFESITVRIQQKLQLKPGRETIDVAELTVENVFYPDEDRDNNGRAEGPLFIDFKAGLAPFEFLADVLVDWEEDDATSVNTALFGGLGKLPGVERSGMYAYIGHRFAKGISSIFTGGGYVRLGPKWTVGGFYQYDYRNDRSLNQQFFVARTFHRFKLRVQLYKNGTNDDRGVRLEFGPVEFFDELRRIRRGAEAGQFRGDY